MSTVEKGFIFVLTNSSQPDLVLIGAGTDHPERALREGLLDDAISGQSPTLCYTALVDNLNAATSQVDRTLPSSSFGTGYFEGTTTDAVMAIRTSGAEILYEEATGVDIPPLSAPDIETEEQIQVDASQQLVPVEQSSDQELDLYEDENLWQQQDIRVNPRPRSWGPVPRGRRNTTVNPYRSNIRDRQARKQDALRKLAAAVDGGEVGSSKPAMIIDDQQPVGLGTGANAFVPRAKAKNRGMDDALTGLTDAPQHQSPHARTVQQSSARHSNQTEPELTTEPELNEDRPHRPEATGKAKKKTAREPQLTPIGDLPEDLSKNSRKNISNNAQSDEALDSLNDISMNWLWKRDNDVNTRRETGRDVDEEDERSTSETDASPEFDADKENFVYHENLAPQVTPGLDSERIQSESKLHKNASTPQRKADAAPARPGPMSPDVPTPDAEPADSPAASVEPVKPKHSTGSKVPASQMPTPTLEIPLHEHDSSIQQPPPKPPLPTRTVEIPTAADRDSAPETVSLQKRQSPPPPRSTPPKARPAPAAERPTATPPPPPLAKTTTAQSPAVAKPIPAPAPVSERQSPPPASTQSPGPAPERQPPPPAGRQKSLTDNPRRAGGAVVKIPGGKKETDETRSDKETSPVPPPPTVPGTRPQKAAPGAAQAKKPNTSGSVAADSVTARPSPNSGKSSPPPASPRSQHDHASSTGRQPIKPPVAPTAPPPNIPLPRVPRANPEDSFDAPAPATSVPVTVSGPSLDAAHSTPSVNPVPSVAATPVVAAAPASPPGVSVDASPPGTATPAAKPARTAAAAVDPGEIESWVQSQDKTHGRRISNRRATRWSMLGIPLGALAGAAYLVLNPQVEQMSKISIVVGGIVTGIIVCFLLARLLLTDPKY